MFKEAGKVVRYLQPNDSGFRLEPGKDLRVQLLIYDLMVLGRLMAFLNNKKSI